MDFLFQLDAWAFHAINQFTGLSSTLDRIVLRTEAFGLKGLALMWIFGFLWFRQDKDQIRTRQILLAMLLAVPLTLIANRAISFALPFRIRPMSSPDINFQHPTLEFYTSLEAWSSFPSDTATLVFAIATGFWMASRFWGPLFAAFSVVTMFARVYFGVHWPGDIIVGALLGIVGTIGMALQPVRGWLTSPFLVLERV